MSIYETALGASLYTHGRVPAAAIAATPPENPVPDHILPPAARAKLARFAAEQRLAQAALLSAAEATREARADRARLETMFSTIADTASPDVVARQERVLADADAAIAQAAETQERATERARAFDFLANLRSAVDQWASLRATAKAVSPPIVKSRDPRADVLKVRAELGQLANEAAAVQAAPIPANDLIERAVREIDTAAAKGALTVNPGASVKNPIELDAALSIGLARPSGDGQVPWLVGTAGAYLFAWLHRDALVAAVKREIEALDLRGALSDRQRASRFEELAEQRLELERREEALISLAEASGQIIARRPDVDARAFLSVET